MTIRVYGTAGALAAFLARLAREAPAEARVERVATTPIRPGPDVRGFQVLDSVAAAAGGRDLPPDLATCAACLRELFDPADRRYR